MLPFRKSKSLPTVDANGLEIVENRASQTGVHPLKEGVSTLRVEQELRTGNLHAKISRQSGVANLDHIPRPTLAMGHCHQGLTQVAYRKESDLLANDF